MKKIHLIIASVAAVVSLVAVPAYAQTATNPTQSATPAASTGPTQCGSTKTQLISCSDSTGVGTISALIKMAVTALTVLIGIVAVGGIAYAAVLYASARDNQAQISNAIGIIRNVIIGIVMYGFTIAIINWLIPGGVIAGDSSTSTPSSGASTNSTTPSSTGSSTSSQ